jgi:hypothetical protein
MTVIAVAGIGGWLLIVTIAVSFGSATNRGDGLRHSALRYLPANRSGVARADPVQ